METISKLSESNSDASALRPEQLLALFENQPFFARLKDQLDLTEQSIARLDGMLTEFWPTLPTHIDEIVVLFGSYLGETIRRQLNWTWIQAVNGGWQLEYKNEFTLVADPFVKMQKRLVNGQDDNLENYFRCLKAMSIGMVSTAVITAPPSCR